jgi:hypothetical protein
MGQEEFVSGRNARASDGSILVSDRVAQGAAGLVDIAARGDAAGLPIVVPPKRLRQPSSTLRVKTSAVAAISA